MAMFISCKGTGGIIQDLSSKKHEDRLQASVNLVNKAKDIKPHHIKIIEKKLSFIKDGKIIYNVLNAISNVKSKKVNNMILRFLSKRNYNVKDKKTLWLIMEIFVNSRDERILTAMPVGLRFNRQNYKIFAWGYAEFSSILHFKDLYVIYRTTPSGEIRRYLRVTLNKILKENGIYINNQKELKVFVKMLRTTWKYMPGTGRDYKDELNHRNNNNGTPEKLKEKKKKPEEKEKQREDNEKKKSDKKNKSLLKKELEKAFERKMKDRE